MTSQRTAWILALLLVLLGGVAYWDDWQTKRESTQAQQEKRVLTLDPDAITRVVYQSSEGAGWQVEVMRDEGTWRVVQPFQASGDSAAIDRFVKTISEYGYERVLKGTGAKNWAKYGLEKPIRSITLGGDQGERTLHVGSKTPVGYSVYLRVSDSETVYVGSQYLLTSTAKKMRDFRDRSFVKIDTDRLQGLTYVGKESIGLRKVKGDYQIHEPGRYPADQDEISDFIADMQSMKAEDFQRRPNDALRSRFGKGRRLAQLTWRYEGQSQQLLFAEHDGKLWAAYDPAEEVFQIPATDRMKVVKSLIDFRDRRIVRADMTGISALEVDGELYRKVESDWYLASEADELKGDSGKKIEPRLHIQNFLVDLTLAKTERFVSFASVQRQLSRQPAHTVKVVFSEGEKRDPIIVRAWRDTSDTKRFFVRVDDSRQIYYVSDDVFANTEMASLNHH